MRLIDADAFIEYANNRQDLFADELTGMINEQQTAYDVENVVAELEDIKKAVSGCFGTMCSECKYTEECYEGEKGYKVAIDKAIDIVKRGGVE